jgi:hypothetical protein
MEKRNLHEEIIKVCFKIARRGEKALILVGDIDYKQLVEQEIKPFNVIKNPKLLESLALMEGAIIIDKDGNMKAYGVKIKSKLTWKNFGTKHIEGISASINEGNTVYVISNEDLKIRIFKEGKLILEIDAKEKNIEKKIPEISKILESIGIGTVSVIGLSAIAPVVGIVINPGITIFVLVTGVSYFLKKAVELKWIK